MFRWFKLFRDQYVGFWTLGLILFALQEIPYMVMPLFRMTDNSIMNMQESSFILGICEKILGSLCIAIMCFIVQEKATAFSMGDGINKAGFVLAVVILLLNFLGWGLYFSGYQTLWVMMLFIVALPPLYYAAIGLWRQNWILLIAGIVFEVVHFVHVYGNLTM
ncbi:MAG: hypothetical protein ACOX7K_08470 [Oscillospiraceae bacterium]|jgi:hypothetical protein